MKPLVVYYSLTGKRKLIFQVMTEAPNATLFHLDCSRNN